jgi:hypothetical protein
MPMNIFSDPNVGGGFDDRPEYGPLIFRAFPLLPWRLAGIALGIVIYGGTAASIWFTISMALQFLGA